MHARSIHAATLAPLILAACTHASIANLGRVDTTVDDWSSIAFWF